MRDGGIGPVSGVTPMAALDLGTRWWWRLVGREVDLDGRDAWLRAPVSPGPTVGRSWFDGVEGLRAGHSESAGLLRSFDALRGPSFDPAAVVGEVRSFYERTSRWRLDVWSQWSRGFQPGGALIGALFGRRVQQLALPIEPLATSRGMVSEVVPFVDAVGVQQAAAWVRTLRSTGETVFSGCYAVRSLPGSAQPLVHVTFPLERGNVQVFLEPRAHGDGSFSLVSGPGAFGAPGAYVVAESGGRHYAARVPIHETFHLFLDEEGVLRTDHVLKVGSATALRMHYKLTRSTT